LLATGIEGVVTPRKPFLARAARWRVDETLCVPKTTESSPSAMPPWCRRPAGAPPVARARSTRLQEGRHVAAVIGALVRGKRAPALRASTLGEFLTLGGAR